MPPKTIDVNLALNDFNEARDAREAAGVALEMAQQSERDAAAHLQTVLSNQFGAISSSTPPALPAGDDGVADYTDVPRLPVGGNGDQRRRTQLWMLGNMGQRKRPVSQTKLQSLAQDRTRTSKSYAQKCVVALRDAKLLTRADDDSGLVITELGRAALDAEMGTTPSDSGPAS